MRREAQALAAEPNGPDGSAPGKMRAILARPEFRELPYAVFHSGPSATADIEGVLILGAQGVRSLTVVLAPRRQSS